MIELVIEQHRSDLGGFKVDLFLPFARHWMAFSTIWDRSICRADARVEASIRFRSLASKANALGQNPRFGESES
jgi:hypothetical protein